MIRLNVFYTSGQYDVENREQWNGNDRFTQHIGAFVASISAFAAGTVISWTSPATPQLLRGDTNFTVNEYDVSLIGSLMPIGAAISSIPIGYLTDTLGRKTMLLTLVPIFLLGWSLIIWPWNVQMIFAGRILTGMCVGAICVITPVYTAEISHKDIRGELASYFQVMMACGIMITYGIGSQLNLFQLSIACAMVPIIFGVAFLFLPDTPVYHMNKGHLDRARESLKFFRGCKCDIDQELSEVTESYKISDNAHQSAWEIFVSRQGMKALTMSVGMMAVQQLCGINAFMFYTTTIFQNSGSSLEPKYATVVVGFMQFVGTIFAMFLIDKIGRVILLGLSATLMAVSTFVLGVYFHLRQNVLDTDNLTWLPLLSLCVFSIMFAVGYGPIPWVLMPEIIPTRIVGISSSIACVVNWLCAFLVTKFFTDLEGALGSDVTFCIFSTITFLGAVFSFTVLPETKGKSLAQIQKEIQGSS